MTREEVQRLIQGQRQVLQEMGVRSLAVFGSVVQGTSGPDSDVDFLVEFSRPVGLFEFIRLKDTLEGILGSPVDLVTPDALREPMRPIVLQEAVDVIPQLAAAH